MHPDLHGHLVRPLALDLCCGKGGWTLGLVAAGWDVIGFDVTDWGYTERTGQRLVLGDVREIHIQHQQEGWVMAFEQKPGGSWIDWPLPSKPLLVCASPPCQEFSYRSFPFKRCRELARTTPPDKSIWEACVRIAKECKAPLVLENVRGAVPYMGKAASHYGSFYLWGDLPPLLPIGRPVKGFVGNKEAKKLNPSDPFGAFSHQKFPGETKRTVPVGRWGEMPRTAEKYRGKVMVGSEKYRRIGGSANVGHHNSKSRAEWSAQAAMIPLELSTWIGRCYHPDGI